MKFIVGVQQALKKNLVGTHPRFDSKRTIMNDLRWGYSIGRRVDDGAVVAEAATNIFDIVIG